MKNDVRSQKRIETGSLLAIGCLLLAIAWMIDPIGASPDTGVFDLGSTGTRWLLAMFGLFFCAAGLWSWRKSV